MSASTISSVAEATGLTASALRFYENAGLISPERTPAGYRTYSDDDITTLRFVSRTKRLGLSLDEIAELVPLLDARRCEPVQDRLRMFVGDRIVQTRHQITDLVAFAEQLETVAGRLGEHTPDGACDERCGCTTEPAAVEDHADPAGEGDDAPTGGHADAPDGGNRMIGNHWVAARIGPARRGEASIVCTLGSDAVEDRMAAWHDALGGGERQCIDGGVRVRLPRTTDLVGLAQLIADEQTCCSFFSFSLTVSSEAVDLAVTAPAAALDLVHALVGAQHEPATTRRPRHRPRCRCGT